MYFTMSSFCRPHLRHGMCISCGDVDYNDGVFFPSCSPSRSGVNSNGLFFLRYVVVRWDMKAPNLH